MTTRRGFLGAILAAAAAPAFVKAGSLMKPAPIWTPPSAVDTINAIKAQVLQLATGEIGELNGVRFIEQRELPRNAGDTIKFRRLNPFKRRVESPVLSVEAINRAYQDTVIGGTGGFMVFVHPAMADDFRAEGVKVEREIERLGGVPLRG